MLPEDPNADLIYKLALSFVPGIGPKITRNLLTRYSSLKEIFNAPAKQLKSVEGMNELRVSALKDVENLKKAEKELKFIEKHDIRTFFIADEDYPYRLKQCGDAPALLFYQGNADLNAEKTIAVIGTRKFTDYGQRLCEDLVADLKSQPGLLIMSGLAEGIDTIAHRNAVKAGIPTVGVLGHGLDRIYPSVNKALSKEMIENGGLLSEYHAGTEPNRENFPMRNRIVAGLSDVTIVVESNIKGGALITAYLASSYNRDVAAFPGRVYDTRSAGCNMLIRTSVAAMITNASDLMQLMNWQPSKQKRPVQQKLFLNLSDTEQMIVDMLEKKDQVHADELLNHTQLTNTQLASILLGLEMQDIIKSLPGKNYRIN